MKRRQGYVVRVLLVHGLLLVVVLGVVTVSLRYQYGALRDQTADEQRAEQKQAARQTVLLTETYFRARVAELFRHPDAWRTPTTTTPTTLSARDAEAVVYVFSRSSGRTRSPTPAPRDVTVDARAVAFLQSVDRLCVAGPFKVGRDGGDDAMLLAAPGTTGDEVVFTPLFSAQLATAVLAPLRRIEARSVALLTSQGAYVAGDDLRTIGPADDGRLQTKLRQVRETGGTADGPVTGVPETWMTVQPVNVAPGHAWVIVLIDSTRALDDTLRPLVTGLVTWTALVAVAVTIVLASTAAGLIRVRRRVENLRQEMLSRDLAKARRIQLNWLPAPRLTTPFLDMAAENRPAAHISGDFYNWIDLPATHDYGGRTAIVLGDVTGHGLPAAFLMATTQLLVKSTIQRVNDPGVCLTEVNHQLASLVYNGQFVTMLIMVIDHDTGDALIASAGQGPPLACRAGAAEACEWLELPIEPQLVLGVVDSMEYVTQRVPLPEGGSLLLYTDGITEAANEAGEQFGLGRMRAALAAGGSGDPAALVASMTSALKQFAGDELDDDLTLIAIRLLDRSHGEAEVPHLDTRQPAITMHDPSPEQTAHTGL